MPSKIKQYTVDLESDSSGDATEYTVPVRGKIHTVKVDYGSGVASGADITITDESLGRTIYSNTDTNSDVTTNPRVAVQDNAGSDVTYDGTNEIYDYYSVHSRLKVVLAQAGDTKSVTVTFIVEEH